MQLFGRKEKKERKKIEVTLTKSGIILRLIFMVIALSIASYSFYYIFTKLLHTESGWQMITAESESSASSEFTFYYQIGVSGTSASQEWGTLNKLYPTLLDRGYNIFGIDEAEGVGNLYQLNSHPNEEVYIEPELYDALQRMQEAESRIVYYAPVYVLYKSLFACTDDYSATNFDPVGNEELTEYVKTVCSFAKTDEHIRVELLGNSKAKLVVSGEYLNFAKENEIEVFLDFYYAKNAFLIDYVADNLTENGYRAGVLTSIEGFARALGEGNYTINRYYYQEGNTAEEVNYYFDGPQSIVSLRDFLFYGERNPYLYKMEDGTTRHIFIDPETGLSREGVHQVLAKSENLGCSDILLKLYDAFVEGEKAIDELNKYGMTID